jgi:hypothetical protein
MDALNLNALQIFPTLNAPVLRLIGVSVDSDDPSGLILNCSNVAHADAVMEYALELCPLILGMGYRYLKVKVGAKLLHDIDATIPQRILERGVMMSNALEKKILTLAENSGRPFSVIRMKDHKGLLTSQNVELVSGVKSSDWIGADMSRYWPDDELRHYCDALEKHKQLKEYSYRALLFTGEPRIYTVNAELIYWRGDWCRLVENLACDPG